ncbi:MAG: FkbM family methyltransferase [Pseudomonadota bacterium]
MAAVLDVGVQKGTGSLIEVYPDVPHLLFEPVKAFAPDIARTYDYKRIKHQLFEVALSDVDGSGLMEVRKTDGEEISHAWVSNRGESVRLARLDTLVPQSGASGPYLLKIDVDGADAPGKIIDGAAGVMKDVSCVVCEMVVDRFFDLSARIQRHGFVLWDIVECSYYDDVFYQCDVLFLRREQIESEKRLKPFGLSTFDPRKWWGSHD